MIVTNRPLSAYCKEYADIARSLARLQKRLQRLAAEENWRMQHGEDITFLSSWRCRLGFLVAESVEACEAVARHYSRSVQAQLHQGTNFNYDANGQFYNTISNTDVRHILSCGE